MNAPMASLQTESISAVAGRSEEVLQLRYEFGKVKKNMAFMCSEVLDQLHRKQSETVSEIANKPF